MLFSYHRVRAFTDALMITVAIGAGAQAFGIYVSIYVNDFIAINFPPSPERQDQINYPNPYEFQYVLPDKERTSVADDARFRYNTAVDMHAKSFSAHMPIKVHAELRFEKESIPQHYSIPDTMHVVFVGSHNLPATKTGLGEGYYAGYITAKISRQDNETIWYEGNSIIQYEMSGQYPVYISHIPPAIDTFDPNLAENWPTINIASEAATNAVRESEAAARNQLRQDGLTFAILAVSFAAARPAALEIIDQYLKPRKKPIDTKDHKSGYGGKPTNDH